MNHPSPGAAPADAVSIVIPAFNEEESIRQAIREVHAAMGPSGIEYELIVVDDGSQDQTAAFAQAEGAQVVRLPENSGYGAALKAGIARSRFQLIAITDADCTYPADQIPVLVSQIDGYDMVVGARIGSNVAIPAVRKPAKWFLRKLAAYLAGRPIPDLNSGLRVMRRSLIRRSAHLLPQGFSFTTTITLSALCGGSLVRYLPIDYHPRTGQSKIRPGHAFDFLLLIIRTIVYFNPLKIFLPAGAVFFAGGLAKFIYDLYIGNLSESAITGVFGAVALWSVGLLSDQIAKVAMRTDAG
jgi:glycosyltransferase involved in cell wall biosynthesis